MRKMLNAPRKLTRDELYLNVEPNSSDGNGLRQGIGIAPDPRLVRGAN
jgi:hypothetical protein